MVCATAKRVRAGGLMLTPGTRLGPYEITGKIGAGGMGEVYKARDTRLGRTVAIKVLPTEVSADEARRLRLEREARAISGLSHPHICTLYDVGEHDGAPFLVMEHLEGETLKMRLDRAHGRGLPLAEALRIGAELAEALEAAHRQGVLHRDLKPANVMLTASGAKLLDFGVARLTGHGERPAWAADASASTEPDTFTEHGTVLGTWPYMAPEQLEGKPADPRTDLWALGCVLYEMVTGTRAFSGDSQASLITAIMESEPPPLSQVQPITPPALERLVRRCLAKLPGERWASAHDLAAELRWIAEGGARATEAGSDRGLLARSQRRKLAWTTAAFIAVAGLTAALMWQLRPVSPPAPAPVVRSLLDVTPADELNAGAYSTITTTPGGSNTALAWTPDGSALVFVGRRDGVCQLFVRKLSEAEARPLPGTEGARTLAVRGDGRSVAFWANGAIREVALDGGPVTTLVEVARWPPAGMAWGARGQLLFALEAGGSGYQIWRSVGGVTEVVTELAEGEVEHTLPQWLPGETTFLYTVRHRYPWGGEELVAQSGATGKRTVLLRDAVDARYAAGHLVFMRLGTLYAATFDPANLAVTGEPVAMFDKVSQALTGGSHDETGAGQFALAPTGSLAYVAGPVLPPQIRRLVAVDRSGRVTPLPVPERSERSYADPRVSPDGRRIAVTAESVTEENCGSTTWVAESSAGYQGTGSAPNCGHPTDSDWLATGSSMGRKNWSGSPRTAVRPPNACLRL